MWQRTNLDTLAASYSNLFLLITILLAIGALLALFLRHGPAPATATSHAAIEIG